jgi:3-oxoacyl-[acyl-carrier-protein] synthase III
MGAVFSKMNAYFEYLKGDDLPEYPKQVYSLAEKSLKPLIESGLPDHVSHLIAATTCPDSLAPSLGQLIIEKFNHLLKNCHSIDIVQGCAGGVSSLILGSQLAELNKSSVLVVQADAAKKATSVSKGINKIFGNGSFVSLITYSDSDKGLLHSKSRQYKGLSEVVTVNLGHNTAEIILKEKKNLANDPRIHLGLSMNNLLAIRLMRNAEEFYIDFVKESTAPDVMILHQVNPSILRHLKSVFKKYKLEFVNVSESTGNCGVPSVGIALNSVKDTIQGKKVLLCSFGTGGVITAGLWQC